MRHVRYGSSPASATSQSVTVAFVCLRRWSRVFLLQPRCICRRHQLAVPAVAACPFLGDLTVCDCRLGALASLEVEFARSSLARYAHVAGSRVSSLQPRCIFAPLAVPAVAACPYLGDFTVCDCRLGVLASLESSVLIPASLCFVAATSCSCCGDLPLPRRPHSL